MAAVPARRPEVVVGPDGYRFVAGHGGIFTFGFAPVPRFDRAQHLNQPIVGMATC
jgi:hypothetical protein